MHTSPVQNCVTSVMEGACVTIETLWWGHRSPARANFRQELATRICYGLNEAYADYNAEELQKVLASEQQMRLLGEFIHEEFRNLVGKLALTHPDVDAALIRMPTSKRRAYYGIAQKSVEAFAAGRAA